MPAGGFKNFNAGAVLTASDVNAYLMQGVLVFTNEAARDASVTSPVEGMVAYLTAPTEPDATGGTTTLPSGVRTIYNGSVWVCVTPVGAFTSNTGTTTSTTFTATLSSGGTNPSVTLRTGTTARVMFSATAYNSSAVLGGNISVAVSGAGTVAASSSWAASTSATTGNTVTSVGIISGLTAGLNTFTLQYNNADGVTLYAANRRLMVEGIA